MIPNRALMTVFTLSAGIATAGTPALAQRGPDLREMATDRPNVTNTPTTVDAGHVQIEFGAVDRSLNRDGGGRERTTSVAEADIRVGVTDALELNLVLRPFASMAVRDAAGGREAARGFGDMTVGTKLNFWGNDGGDAVGASAFAAQLQVNLPSAKDDLGAGRVEAMLSLPFRTVLPAGFALNLQPTLSRMRSDSGRMVTGYQGAAEIDHDLGPLNLYAEYVFDDTSERGAPDEQVVNLGATAKLGDNLVLDGNVGLGVNRAADDFRILTGISVRF